MSDIAPNDRSSPWPIWGGLALMGLTLVAAFAFAMLRLGHRTEKPLPIYGQITDFTLTNENDHAISLADLRGKVWVADIIFTRCAGPCPIMTRHMKQIQDLFPPGSQARLVTLTTDPDFDTPAVMRKYAERFGADTNRWLFLTGTKPEIGKLAVDSLKLSAVPKQPGERTNPDDLFVHSTIFVVVDRQARLRGIFQTTGEGIDPQQEIARIVAAVDQLEHEG